MIKENSINQLRILSHYYQAIPITVIWIIQSICTAKIAPLNDPSLRADLF